jgi:hypothetical protein
MLNLHEVKITTPHLQLTPLTAIYASEIYNEFTDEITTYMFPKPLLISQA